MTPSQIEGLKNAYQSRVRECNCKDEILNVITDFKEEISNVTGVSLDTIDKEFEEITPEGESMQPETHPESLLPEKLKPIQQPSTVTRGTIEEEINTLKHTVSIVIQDKLNISKKTTRRHRK